MTAMVSQITCVSTVRFVVCSSADQREYQISVSLAFVRGIHRWPVNSLHKRPVTRKMLPKDDVTCSFIFQRSGSRISLWPWRISSPLYRRVSTSITRAIVCVASTPAILLPVFGDVSFVRRWEMKTWNYSLNIKTSGQKSRHFAHEIFKCCFLTTVFVFWL